MKKCCEDMRGEFEKLSPLEIGNTLLKYELYDKESAEDVINRINEEFKGKGHIVDTLVTPAFFNIFDNISSKLNMNKKGITPSRLINECQGFNYDSEEKDETYEYTELENSEVAREREFDRKKFDNTAARKKYRDERFKDGENKTVKSDYDGKVVYNKIADAESRNFKSQTSHQSDVDHVIPIKEVYKRMGSNIALTDDDIKDIVNIKDNYAIVNADINRKKGEMTNEDYIKKYEVDEATRQRMLDVHNRANNSIEDKQNKTVLNNLINNKPIDSKSGEGVRDKVLKETSSQSFKDSGSAAVDNALGEVIILFVKTSYYEITESIKYGIMYKLNAITKLEAFKLRMKRAVGYVIGKAKEVFSGSLMDFVKGFISSFASCIINLFTGFIKRAWDIVRKGFTAIVSAIKLIISPPEGMTKAQIADAVVKLIATAVIGICGEALDQAISTLLEKIPFLDKISPVLTAIITGLLATLVVYLLDKIDLFGAKREMRMARIREVFAERAAEIRENTENFNKAALEVLISQRVKFETIRDEFMTAFKSNDYDNMSGSMYKMADHLGVELEYSTSEEFADFLDCEGSFEL